MTVKELLNRGFSPVVVCDEDRTVSGVYIGDLLSWVMGRASADNAWITIMSNINVIAVASLADTSCVILAEGVELSEDVIKAAFEKNVNVISSSKPAYETAIELSELLV